MNSQEEITQAFGNLAEIYNDSSVTEIIVDGPNQVRFTKEGKIFLREDIFSNSDEIKTILKNLFKLCGREYPEKAWGDIRLSDSTRVMAVSESLSLNGPVFNLVKLPQNSMDWDSLIKHKVISEEGKNILQEAMKAGKNVILGGSLGSGRTTLANNIVSLIPDTHRIVCLEKVPSLILKKPWLVRLQTAENKNENMYDLLKAAYMMRSDYLVINEIVRDEVPLMLDMMRDGYSIFGCMTADSSEDVLRRLELKYISTEVSFTMEQIKEIIANSLDYIVFIKNTDNGRRVTEIIEVSGTENGKYIINPVYRG